MYRLICSLIALMNVAFGRNNDFRHPTILVGSVIYLCYPFHGMLLAGGLSTSPRRRPPRIRPKRQQNPSSSADLDYTNDDKPRIDESAKEKTQKIPQKHEQALQDPSLLTRIRFTDREDIHPYTRKALVEGLGLQAMTQVQAKTYAAALRGESILARSRTGTGKTLAFLLPTIERLVSVESENDENQADYNLYRQGRSIGCIILAPTRELAIQIADQAELVLDFHNRHRTGNRKLTVACIYGGVKMQRDVRLLTGEYQGGGRGSLPTILVATPSRLLEHLEGNSPLSKQYRSSNSNNNLVLEPRKKQSNNKFADIVSETKIVVLDETDRLLQKSNQHETQRVLSFLARPEKRQTLLFSATIPRAVRRLLSTSSIVNNKKQRKQTLERDSHRSDGYIEVDCIGDGAETMLNTDDVTTSSDESEIGESNKSSVSATKSSLTARPRIEESFVVLKNMTQFIPTLLSIIRREKERDNPDDYKILVFFPSGRMVRFLYQFFTIGGIVNPGSSPKAHSIWEIHSRMSQSSRTRASNAFRSARRGILFSSDVSARGLDYPDISLVVQMGAPASDQDYIHRIGRTGRAGQAGRSLLVLLPFESDKLKDRNNNSHRRRQQARKRSGKASYRNDENISKDNELASWLVQDNGGQTISESASSDDERSKTDNVSVRRLDSLYQQCQADLESTRWKVRSGHVVLTPSAEAAYTTFLAHYTMGATTHQQTKNNSIKGKNGGSTTAISATTILGHADDFAKGMGLTYTPELDEDFASKLGLS